MKKGVFVYISGPITEKSGYIVEENVAKGLKTFLALTRLGIPSFAPQLQAIFPSAHGIDYHVWMEYDFAIIDFCTHMLMLPRWTDSPGAKKEREFAETKGIPVYNSIEDLIQALEE